MLHWGDADVNTLLREVQTGDEDDQQDQQHIDQRSHIHLRGRPLMRARCGAPVAVPRCHRVLLRAWTPGRSECSTRTAVTVDVRPQGFPILSSSTLETVDTAVRARRARWRKDELRKRECQQDPAATLTISSAAVNTVI